VAAFVIIAIGLTWAAQILSILILGNVVPGLLAELLILLGAAVLVSAAVGGRAGIRHLFRGVVHWRAGAGWYAIALLAVPVLTLLIAAATGTFHPPGEGWAALLGNYLFNTVVFGALLANVWEELAWTGLVQRRLMQRRGLLLGSLLTAIPFALIHLPLAFAEKGFTGTPVQDVLFNWAVLFLVAPVFRLLAGITYLETGGSILIVGLLHASFNASGSTKLTAFDGEWQQIAAIIVLLAALALYRSTTTRRTRRTADPGGPDQTDSAAGHTD
jgi:membrane protease YdiL (CAAX protease family)